MPWFGIAKKFHRVLVITFACAGGKNPFQNQQSRCLSSKTSYDNVAFNAMMPKTKYQPASFTPSTDLKIEKLLSLVDEIAFYYQVKKP
jgi:hypothetical protein